MQAGPCIPVGIQLQKVWASLAAFSPAARVGASTCVRRGGGLTGGDAFGYPLRCLGVDVKAILTPPCVFYMVNL